MPHTPGRAHVAFMAVPAHGHVNPSLPLVTELVSRGHRITYATNEEFAPQVEHAGATPVLYTSKFPSQSNPDQQAPEDFAGGMTMFLDELIAVLPQVESAYADDVPDLIVYDISAWAAPILAEKWNIPAIQLSPTHVAYQGMEEDLGIDLAAPPPAMAEFYARFAEFVAAQGVGITPLEIQLRPRRCIVTIPRAFQLGAETVPDNYTFVGPMFTERALQGEWQAPDALPVLLISLGSIYTDRLSFYRMCIDAFSGLEWHVVLSTGTSSDPADLGPLPANFEVRPWVPQLKILSQASAFITHAGMGGVMEALYHGVPMVAVPQAVDQLFNGRRLAELGVGRHLSRDEVTAEALRAAVSRVTTDERLAANLRTMRAVVRASGGVLAAVEVIESELAGAANSASRPN